MPNYHRPDVPGGTYFFTVVTFGRQPLLTLAPVRHALRDAITFVKRKYPFSIDAWVLLPDHLHCVWTLPVGDADFSIRWSIIKRMVSKQCVGCAVRTINQSRRQRRELSIWQRRFWEHQIRDESDFVHHVDYIHWNPVKHGHAETVAEWPYSTFHRYVQQGKYAPEWGGDGGSAGEEFGE